ncbi:hypothetical protein [Neotabrizicola sp. VNH66]|uniref:hypothetical protein n=1 Tax=Neotabrizicola sp. VNH66 TaxID=3400918 RepID=UPI003C088DC5
MQLFREICAAGCAVRDGQNNIARGTALGIETDLQRATTLIKRDGVSRNLAGGSRENCTA